jgi:hypothetical protein
MSKERCLDRQANDEPSLGMSLVCSAWCCLQCSRSSPMSTFPMSNLCRQTFWRVCRQKVRRPSAAPNRPRRPRARRKSRPRIRPREPRTEDRDRDRAAHRAAGDPAATRCPRPPPADPPRAGAPPARPETTGPETNSFSGRRSVTLAALGARGRTPTAPPPAPRPGGRPAPSYGGALNPPARARDVGE